MKSLIFAYVTLLVIIATQIISSSSDKTNKKPEYVIVIHGGAGTISKELPDSIKQAYIKSLNQALSLGKNLLANGEKGIDVVEKVIRFLRR